MKPMARHIVGIFLACVMAAPALMAQSPNFKWEAVKTRSENLKHIAKDNNLSFLCLKVLNRCHDLV